MVNIFRKKPILALAPMAGITDSAFRQLCRGLGADLVYSEMISAEGIIYGKPQDYYDWEKKKWGKLSKTERLAIYESKEKPIILQLFGKNPENMAIAAAILVKKFKPTGIDINMGCPAKKVVKSGHGVALMKDPALACEIVKKVKAAVGKKVLVSVKTRLGFTSKNEILKFAPKIEKAGADFICLHGRTYKQGFSGAVDYDLIKKVKKKISIPLIANGGVKTPQQAIDVLRLTRADGLAIGMATWGQPWIFQEIKKYFSGKIVGRFSWAQVKKVILRHAELVYKEKGSYGIIELRKHLCWYVRGQKNAAELRRKLVRVKTVGQIKNVLDS
ncbi:MAG: tRNA-dihydrouridine synthase [Patescibacteria group bacterium]|jgi:tRNA-dihydrouridine synthase